MQFIMEDNIETALIEVFQIVFMHNQPSPVIPQNFLFAKRKKIYAESDLVFFLECIKLN